MKEVSSISFTWITVEEKLEPKIEYIADLCEVNISTKINNLITSTITAEALHIRMELRNYWGLMFNDWVHKY